VELFNGVPLKADNHLAIDHIVPLIWRSGEQYQLHLVARVGHETEEQKAVVGIVRAKSHFTCQQVFDKANWPVHIEAISYPLVASIRSQVSNLISPIFYLLPKGEMAGSQHNMRRIWL
jgi:hypothetical protein